MSYTSLSTMRTGSLFTFYNCSKFFCNFTYNMHILRITKGCHVSHYRVGYSISITGATYLEVIQQSPGADPSLTQGTVPGQAIHTGRRCPWSRGSNVYHTQGNIQHISAIISHVRHRSCYRSWKIS